MVAVAVGGAGILGAGASLFGSNEQANSAQNAQNIEEQQMMLNQQNESPFIQGGTGANVALQQLFGFGPNGAGLQPGQALTQYGLPGSFAFNPTQAQLAATPGYQFDLAQGLNATQNGQAASGRGISGAALKGAASYATGLANNTLMTQDQIFQNNLSNVLNPLQNLSGLGQAAAAGVGTSNTTGAGNTGQAAAGVGQALSGGITGASNSLSNGALGYLVSSGSNPLASTGATVGGTWDQV